MIWPLCCMHHYIRKQSFFIIRDQSDFTVDAYCEEMDRSASKFLRGFDELTKFNCDAAFDAFVSVVHSVIENHAPP